MQRTKDKQRDEAEAIAKAQDNMKKLNKPVYEVDAKGRKIRVL